MKKEVIIRLSTYSKDQMLNKTYPFIMPDLPYGYEDLEPQFNSELLIYHHDKHFQSYVDNLNKAIEKYPVTKKFTLKELLIYSITDNIKEADLKKQITRHGGGTYNHDIFFRQFQKTDHSSPEPTGLLKEKIDKSFGSFDKFKQIFTKQALDGFGSTWTTLAINKTGDLAIATLKDQETTIALGMKPIITIDMWEHAYYLQYKNDKQSYIDKFWEIIQFPELKICVPE